MMRDTTFAWIAAFGLIAAVFTGCPDDETSTTAPAASGPVTATGPGSSSSSMMSTSTGMDCTNVMAPGDSPPACDTCMQMNCCPQLLSMSGADLVACAQMFCQACFTPICDSMFMGTQIGYFFSVACGTCVGGGCCQATKDCLDDMDCANCILMMDMTACAATTLDDDFNLCRDCNCAQECNVMTGAGGGCPGTGGAGGVGGTGGAGGIGGAGGN